MPEVPARRDLTFKTGPGDKQTPNLLGRNWATLKERAKARKEEQATQVKTSQEVPVGPVTQSLMDRYADLPGYETVGDAQFQPVMAQWDRTPEAQNDPIHAARYYSRVADYYESQGDKANAAKFRQQAATSAATAQQQAWEKARQLPSEQLPAIESGLDRSAGDYAAAGLGAGAQLLLTSPKDINLGPGSGRVDPYLRNSAVTAYNNLAGKTDLISAARRNVLEPFTHLGTTGKFNLNTLARSTGAALPLVAAANTGIQLATHDQDTYEDDVNRRAAALKEMSPWRRAAEYTNAAGQTALGVASNFFPGAGKLVGLAVDPYDAAKTLTAGFSRDELNPYLRQREQQRENVADERSAAQMRQLVEQLHPDLPVAQKDQLAAQWTGQVSAVQNWDTERRKMQSARSEAYQRFGGRAPRVDVAAAQANVYSPLDAGTMDQIYGEKQWTPEMADNLGRWQHMGLLDSTSPETIQGVFDKVKQTNGNFNFQDPFAARGGEGLRKSTVPAYQPDTALAQSYQKYFNPDGTPNRDAWDATRTRPDITPEGVIARGNQQVAAADAATAARASTVNSRDAAIKQQQQTIAQNRQASDARHAAWKADYDARQSGIAQQEAAGQTARNAWASARGIPTTPPTATPRPTSYQLASQLGPSKPVAQPPTSQTPTLAKNTK